MPRKARRRIPSVKPQLVARAAQRFHVLLVDTDPKVRKVLADAISGEHMVLLEAASLAEARTRLRESEVDLALIEPNLPDGSGMDLAHELDQTRSTTQTIVISDQPNLQRAVEAIRAGAADFIAKPLDLDELNERVRVAIDRHKVGQKQQMRIRRLRRICKKLNIARQEVTQQVDILCNDLVTAYQELAAQMQHVVYTSEFAALVRNELDLENLLRKTLEYLVHKAGSTNAAIFLPATGSEYSLGGYVNYDCTPDSADLLLQHLADVVAPLLAERDAPVHITDNQTLGEWLGDDFAYLADSHVLGFACPHDDETLAVVVLFRDGSQPFDADVLETTAAIAPLLGQAMARIIRVHHRQINDSFDNDEEEIPF